MLLTVEHIQGEERDGFYVQPLMKRVWAAELEVLKEIDGICRRHHIKYYAWYGTLLGAVRHQGFIPWDDDIDLAMLRDDYERFRYFLKTELPEGWQVNVHPTWLSIFNRGSRIIGLDQDFLDRFHGCPYKVGIDIFCLDSIPEDETEEQILSNLFSAAFNVAKGWDSFEEDRWEERAAYAREIGELAGYSFNEECSVKEQMKYLADRIPAMYWEEFGEITSYYMHTLLHQPDYRIPRCSFDKIVEVPFENTTIPILEDYDLICRLSYGDDYMIPVRDYKNHEYPFFKPQIDALRNYFEKRGEGLPGCFDMICEEGTE